MNTMTPSKPSHHRSTLILVAGLCLALLVSVLAVAQEEDLADETALAFTANDPRLEWGPCPPPFPDGCEIAILHGDPAQPAADLFFKVPEGYDIPRHWHSSAERMVLVSGELSVTYDGQEPIVLESGMYAYGPARVPHEAACRDAGTCVLFIAFVGPVDAYAGEPSDGP